MEAANVNYAQRFEFRANPARSAALLEAALRRRSVKKPAAYALARLRAESMKVLARTLEDRDPEPEPPTLEALELAWSWGATPAAVAAMGAAIARAGGLANLRPLGSSS